MRSLPLTGLWSLTFLMQAARGDGLIFQLPANGATVRYKMEYAVSTNCQVTATGTIKLTLADTGTTALSELADRN